MDDLSASANLDEEGNDTRPDDVTLPAGSQKAQDLKDAQTAVEFHTQEAERQRGLNNKKQARYHKESALAAFEAVERMTPDNRPKAPKFSFK